MQPTASVIITACWIIFLFYWLARAWSTKQTTERQSLPSALAHRIPIALGWYLMVFFRLPQPWNLQLVPHDYAAMIIGSAVCLSGLFVTIWARRTLAGNWSSDVTFKQDHELIRTGPYRYVRHPIYTGLLIMCLGTAVEVGKLRCWVGLVLVGIGFWIKLNQEERLMLEHFPAAYSLYRKQVKALVPWLL